VRKKKVFIISILNLQLEKKLGQIVNQKQEILLNATKKKNSFCFYKSMVLLASLIWMPFAFSQQIEIKGTITDLVGEPIPNTIIIASSTQNESDIIAFYSSQDDGKYRLTIKENSKLDSLWLVIRHMAYETVKFKIQTKNVTKNFKLTERLEQLDEVLLKSPKKVEIKGDTITYNVKGIKAKKDYTIEDVINRIPGVTISENGQIRYEDKPISHLYINGVDLLEGRYNIATQGIPADAVKEIDIMKKHNHERIKIGRTESDDVAFNLKIKEGVGLVFGSIKGDAGVPIFTGLIEGTPIYLKDNFQNISSIKSNNVGKTLRNIGSSLTNGELNVLAMKLNKTNIIRPPDINGVILSDKYWLDNNSYSITNDALHKISDSTLLKWNINYVNELSGIEKKSSSTFIINNDSSVVVNRTKNQLRKQRLQFGMNQEVNKQNFYAKNNTELQYYDNSGNENSILNDNNIKANYENYELRINNTTFLKTLISKNNILQSGLLIEYNRKSEKLLVIPPVFESVFGDNIINDETIQNIKINEFNIGGFSTYDFKLLNLNWNINQKIQYSKSNFESALKALPNSDTENFPLNSDYIFNRFTSKSKIETKFNIGKLRLKWRLSADYTNLNNKEEKDESIKQNESFFFIQPFASARYNINTKWNLGISYSEDNRISGFSKLYPAVVLENYNSLVQNPEIINKTKSQLISPFLNYSNILKSFFFNVKGRFSQTESEVTFVNQLNDDGFIFTEVVERPNTIKDASFTLNLSKGFLGSFNSNLSYSYSYTENELFFNNELLNTINTRHGINFNLSFDNGSWYALEYDARLNIGSSELPTNKVDNLNFFQTVDLDFYTSSSTRLNFGLESTRTSTSTNNEINNNTLLNMSFFYKPSKKTYLRASLINIFNTDFFTLTNSRANFISTSQFSLRPRQFTIGFTYSL